MDAACGRLGNLTLSFVAVCSYIAIGAFSTTAGDLLRGRSIELPLLRTVIPLSVFSIVSPILLLGLHVYLTINQYWVFTRLVDLLSVGGTENQAGERLQRRLRWDGFVPLLLRRSGSPVARAAGIGLFYGISAVAPLAVLLLLQVKFLALREITGTVTHWVCIVGSAMCVASMARWRGGATEEGNRQRLPFGTWLAVPLALGFSLAGTLFLLHLWQPRLVEELWWEERAHVKASKAEIVRAYPEASKLNEFADKADALLRFAEGIELVNRNLEGANLEGAIMPNCNLDGANLRGARLRMADLRRCKVSNTTFEGADLSEAKLDGIVAEDDGRDGMGVSFVRANLTKAEMNGAIIKKGSFLEADLTGVSMIGTSVSKAIFDGAALERATIRGSSFRGSSFIGAQFPRARIESSLFASCDMRLTRFYSAHLRRVVIERDLGEGENYGVDGRDFRGASFEGATFEDVFAPMTEVSLKGLRVRNSFLGFPKVADLRGISRLDSVEAQAQPEEDLRQVREYVARRIGERYEDQIRAAYAELERELREIRKPECLICSGLGELRDRECDGCIIAFDDALFNLKVPRWVDSKAARQVSKKILEGLEDDRTRRKEEYVGLARDREMMNCLTYSLEWIRILDRKEECPEKVAPWWVSGRFPAGDPRGE